MRDYAELVKALRFAFEEQDCGECALAGTDRCTVGQTCRFKDAADAIEELRRDLKDCRNELCFRCGEYKQRHLGACDGCRWKEPIE